VLVYMCCVLCVLCTRVLCTVYCVHVYICTVWLCGVWCVVCGGFALASLTRLPPSSAVVWSWLDLCWRNLTE
jgi:hypothetical protein